MSLELVVLCAMNKEHMALCDAIEYLRPTVEIIDRAVVGDTGPFATYCYTLRLEHRTSPWRLYLMETGVGKVHAALATQLAIQHYHPKLIVNVGVSGGLYVGARVGDLCLSTAFRYHDVWCGAGNERGQVQGLPAQFAADDMRITQAIGELNIPLKRGLLLCGDTFIPSPEHLKSFVQQHHDLIAVDMESCAIAQTAYLYQTALVSIRIISDTPLTDQDHGVQYTRFWREKSNYIPPFADASRLICALADPD